MLRSIALGLLAALTLASTSALAPTTAFAKEKKTYGKGVTAAEVVKVSELLANPDKYVGKKVRVDGLVTEVCPKRGCWMNIAGDKEFQTMKIKVNDGDIVFPMEAKGKRAAVEGIFTKIELTKEQALERAKHLAEEKGEKFDAAKAKDLPTVVYQIQGTGAVID